MFDWVLNAPLMPYFFQSVTFIYSITGRIDRKIEFPLPDQKTKRRIFNIHTSRMTLADDVDLEEYIVAKDDLSGADIKVCLLDGLTKLLSILTWSQPLALVSNLFDGFLKLAVALKSNFRK